MRQKYLVLLWNVKAGLKPVGAEVDVMPAMALDDLLVKVESVETSMIQALPELVQLNVAFWLEQVGAVTVMLVGTGDAQVCVVKLCVEVLAPLALIYQ